MNGKSIGDNRNEFRSYCGVTVRKTISILIERWDQVPQPEKDQLWLNIKDYWNIPNNKYKNQVLGTCKQQWRTFKSKLLKYMDKDEDPTDVYPYIEKDEWKAYVAQKSTKEFEEIRRKGTNTVKMNKNPARLGPKGYSDMQDQWDKEIELGATILGHHITNKRARDYLFARRKKNASGEYILPNKEITFLAKELVRKDIQVSHGILEIGPRSDLLIEVLGPAHPGRTRGVGCNIGLKQSGIFERKRKKCPLSDLEEITEKIEASDWYKNMYDKIKVEVIAELRDEMKAKIISECKDQIKAVVIAECRDQMKVEVVTQMEAINSSGLKESSVGLTPVFDDLNKINTPTHCELMIPDGMVRRACADATVYPFDDGIIHSIPLKENHLKVSINKVYDGYHSHYIPVPTEEVTNLGNALHSFIQWPRHSIVLVKKGVISTTVPTRNAHILCDKGKTNKKQKVPKKVPMPNKIMGKSAEIQSLYKHFMSYNILEPFHVVSVPGVFKAGSVETYISSSVVTDMLTNEQLDVSCMVWYQIMLHTLLLSSRGVNEFAFINPQNITPRLCQIDVTRHLVDVMRFHQDKEFFLAPYLQGEHWMLIVICPHHRTGYILDSIKSSKSLEYYIVVKHVEEAVGIFNTKSEKSHSESEKSRSRVMKWTLPKCNQQESDWECGYYVLN